MKPLVRNIAIGTAVTLCVALAAGATWWTRVPGEALTLASRLPADAVLAYVRLPGAGRGRELTEWMGRVAPSLPPIREVDESAADAAAVRMADGTEGWIIRTIDERGVAHFGGSDPALAPLLDAPGPKLETDRAFKNIRWDDGAPWGYVAFPRASSDASVLRKLLSLESPLGVRATSSGIVLRASMPSADGFALWSGTPAGSIPDLRHTILLPAWGDMDALSPLLADDARIVAETMGRTLLDGVAPGMSPRYDLPTLLHGPSVLRIGDASFSLEGRGSDAAGTERVLRAMHARFAATRGGTDVKTVSAEGFSLNTITVADAGATVERTDGEWTILETDTEDGSFAGAWNGDRFAITTAPDSLFDRSGDASPADGTSIDWETARDALEPLWPSLRPDGDLRLGMRGGPGYAEWSLEPVSGL